MCPFAQTGGRLPRYAPPMKPKSTALVFFLAALVFAEAVFAQRYYRRQNEHSRAVETQEEILSRQPGYNPYAPRPPVYGVAVPGEGAGPGHRIMVGDRLPPAYFNRNYLVEDYAAHGLSMPPAYSYWYQVGADYVQVNVNNGVVGMVVVAR